MTPTIIALIPVLSIFTFTILYTNRVVHRISATAIALEVWSGGGGAGELEGGQPTRSNIFSILSVINVGYIEEKM